MAKMNDDIRVARNLAKLAKQLAAVGVTTQEIKVTKEDAREARANKPQPFWAAEAVLKFLEKPACFMQKQCARKACGEWFGTNYRGVGYCTDNCRIRSLQEIGIAWDPGKREEERWGGEPPLIVPPAALKKLIQMAQQQMGSENPLPEWIPFAPAGQEDFVLAPPAEEAPSGTDQTQYEEESVTDKTDYSSLLPRVVQF